MNKLLSSFIILSSGLAGGYFAQPFVSQQLQLAGFFSSADETGSSKDGADKVLYWVAPMDANYRRDKPGKSPMGMDLVPVYAGEATEKGVVKVSAVEQNNLGVRIDSVKKAPLDREINTVGYINFDEEKLYHLHTRVDGWVEKLWVKAVGDVVKKGQKLFELYSPQLVNAQEEYVIALKSQNRILIKASKDRLVSLGITRGQIKQLQKTRKINQRIGYYAKHDGFVSEMNIRQGMFVKPAMDVLSIAQINTVWVIAEVFERQSGWVKKGQTVDMTVAAFPEKNWKGIVDYIYPTLEQKTRTLRVRIRFNNSDELLKPNMFSNLTIHSSFNKDVLLVKREAIIRTGTMERVVKALGDGKFLSVAVKTGSESGGYIEIVKGLKEGENIVTSAQFLFDSESSLTASFERMEEPKDKGTLQENSKTTDNKQAWLEGKVVDVMEAHSMLTIQHKAVAVWGWPEMLMDFPVIKTIDLGSLKTKQKIDFLVAKHDDGSIEIIEIKGLQQLQDAADVKESNDKSNDLKDNNQAWIKGKILSVNKEQMQLTLQHEAVKSWGWSAMQMDFPVIKSMDISSLKEQMEFNFLVKKNPSGSLEIIEINREGL
jgi:membrane fusion protein, copper/silver efflux system